jgi:Domain of unknown function (DUF3427)
MEGPEVSGIPGLYLHDRFHRTEIADALGVKQTRNWLQGVVRIGERYLVFVTIDKKHLPLEYRYKDRLLSTTIFHGQSQNQDTREGRGRKYREYAALGRCFHLFVRREETVPDGRSSPFVYLGLIRFKGWKGDHPINVLWDLETAVPSNLSDELLVP